MIPVVPHCPQNIVGCRRESRYRLLQLDLGAGSVLSEGGNDSLLSCDAVDLVEGLRLGTLGIGRRAEGNFEVWDLLDTEMGLALPVCMDSREVHRETHLLGSILHRRPGSQAARANHGRLRQLADAGGGDGHPLLSHPRARDRASRCARCVRTGRSPPPREITRKRGQLVTVLPTPLWRVLSAACAGAGRSDRSCRGSRGRRRSSSDRRPGCGGCRSRPRRRSLRLLRRR
jgi:hypothetical protein